MTIVCTQPSFEYTSKMGDWKWAIFCPLLMRHGPPPFGVKWYGMRQRVHFSNSEARNWEKKLSADCIAAVERSELLSHYKPVWRERHALNIKNRFIRWCRDERKQGS